MTFCALDHKPKLLLRLPARGQSEQAGKQRKHRKPLTLALPPRSVQRGQLSLDTRKLRGVRRASLGKGGSDENLNFCGAHCRCFYRGRSFRLRKGKREIWMLEIARCLTG